MKISIIILVCLLTIACSPEKRLSRLVEKHPELLRPDTIILHDTIILDGLTVDSTFKFVEWDTVFIDTSGVQVKLIHLRDSIRVFIKQKADTIFIEKKIPFKQVVIEKPQWLTYIENHKWQLIIVVVVGLILIMIIRLIFK